MPSNPTSPQDPVATSAPDPAASPGTPGARTSASDASGARTSAPDASGSSASGPGASGAEAPGTRSRDADTAAAPGAPARKPRAVRKQVLLRLDPAVHDAVARWADDELRSVNAQIEVILREALGRAGRAPRDAAPLPRRGRPPST